jgi:hypothetical protein
MMDRVKQIEFEIKLDRKAAALFDKRKISLRQLEEALDETTKSIVSQLGMGRDLSPKVSKAAHGFECLRHYKGPRVLFSMVKAA